MSFFKFVWQFAFLTTWLVSQPLTACEEGWIRYRAARNTKCFKYFPDKVNFQSGLNLCNKMNGTLASVHSFDELTFLEDIARHYSGASGVHWVWLGGLRHSNGSFRWADQSDFSFTRWRHNCPDERRGEDCVLMSVFQTKPSHWCNYRCSNNYDHVICQRGFLEPATGEGEMNGEHSNTTLIFSASNSTETESLDMDNSGSAENQSDNQTVQLFECNIGWTLWEQNCYKFVEQNESWHSALHFCQTFHNASLASVSSEAEQIFLQTFLFSINEANEAVWLGGVRANPTVLPNREKNDQNLETTTNGYYSDFLWIDQRPFSYKNYAPHEPDNRGDNENCLAMNNLDDYLGQWLDAPCNTQFKVACKRLAERVRFSSVWPEDSIRHQAPDLNQLMDRLRQEWQLVERLVSIEQYLQSDNFTERLAERVSQRIKQPGNEEIGQNRPMVGHLSSSQSSAEAAQMNQWVKCSLLLGSLSCAALLVLISFISLIWLRDRWSRLAGRGCRQRSYQSVFSFRNLNYEEKALAQNDYDELTYAQAASASRAQISQDNEECP